METMHVSTFFLNLGSLAPPFGMVVISLLLVAWMGNLLFLLSYTNCHLGTLFREWALYIQDRCQFRDQFLSKIDAILGICKAVQVRPC